MSNAGWIGQAITSAFVNSDFELTFRQAHTADHSPTLTKEKWKGVNQFV